jgi:hypothetical protein
MASKLSDDEIKWVLSLDAKGVQGEVQKLSSVIQKLAKENTHLNNEIKDTEQQMNAAAKEMAKLEKVGKTTSNAYKEAKGTFESAKNEITDYKNKIQQNTKAIAEHELKQKGIISTMKLSDMTMNQLKRRYVDLENQLKSTSKAANPEAYKKLESELKKTGNQINKLSTDSKNLCERFNVMWGAVWANLITEGLSLLANGIKSVLSEGEKAYRDFAESQAKLAQVMSNTMNARKEEVDSIVLLAKEQEKLGVVSKNVQIAGAQELSTYLTKSKTLKKLLPVMNDMVAQQFGINASQEQAANVATMLGKVMDGQTGALKRYGYSFDESQEKILKFGTESERAATLMEVVESAVGGVNQALAKTPEGKIKVASLEFEAVRESLGELIVSLKSEFVPIQTESIKLLSALVQSLIIVGKYIKDNKDLFISAAKALGILVTVGTTYWAGLKLQALWTSNLTKGTNALTLSAIKQNTVMKITNAELAKHNILAAAARMAVLLFSAAKALLTGNIMGARAAMVLFNQTVKSNPLGLVLSLVAAVVVAIIAFRDRTKELSEAQKINADGIRRQKELTEEYSKSITKEKTELNALVSSIVNVNDNNDLRNRLIKQLQEKYPDFLKNLDAEKVTNEQLLTALKSVNDQYAIKLRQSGYQAKIDAQNETAQNYENRRLEIQSEFIKLEKEKDKISTAAYNKRFKALNDEDKLLQKNIQTIQYNINTLTTLQDRVSKTDFYEGQNKQLEKNLQEALDLEKKYTESANEIRNDKSRYHDAKYATELKQSNDLAERYRLEADRLKTQIAENKSIIETLNNTPPVVKVEDDPEKTKTPEGKEKEVKKQLDLQLQQLETAHKKRQLEIEQNAKNEWKTEEEKQNILLAAEAGYLDKRIDYLKKFSTSYPKIQEEVNEKLVDDQLKQVQLKKKLLDSELQTLDKNLQDTLLAEQQNLLDRKITQEKFEELSKQALTGNLQKKLEAAKKYGLDTSSIEKQISDNSLKNQQESDKKILEATLKSKEESLKVLSTNQELDKMKLDRQLKRGVISQTKYNDEIFALNTKYAAFRLKVEQIYFTAVDEMQKKGVEGTEEVVRKSVEEIERLSLELGIAQRAQAEDTKGILGELQEYFANLKFDGPAEQLRLAFENTFSAISELREKDQADWGDYVNVIGTALGGMMNAIAAYSQQAFELETNALEAEKQKQLTIAGDNAEARQAVEDEYAQKELDLKKKKADSDANIQTAQLWITTATGIATAWATAMQLGPIAGPIMAGVLTAALLASAGVQQANIIKQRDAIKNTTLQKSSSSSTAITGQRTVKEGFAEGGLHTDGGYTGDGGRYQVAGYFPDGQPYHKGEYIVAQPELRDPTVVGMVRNIEAIRLRRTSKNATPGFADGGMHDASGTASAGGTIIYQLDPDFKSMILENNRLLKELNANGVTAYMLMSQFDRVKQQQTKILGLATKGDKK